MNNLNSGKIVAVVRNNGKISWYRSDRELWVLDLDKWRKDFTSKGYVVPVTKVNFRSSIFKKGKIEFNNEETLVHTKSLSILLDNSSNCSIKLILPLL